MNNFSNFKKIYIAHIDDDPTYTQIVNQLLDNIAPNTYSIDTYDSSKEAFFTINSNPKYDLIISDFDMPEMNGLELFEQLKQSNIEIPFIMLTGDRKEDIAVKALNAGVKFFLRKEVDLIPLLKQLDSLMKITVDQNNAENELIENNEMITDFITILSNSYSGINDTIYTHMLFQKILHSFLVVTNSEHIFLNELSYNEHNELSLSDNFLATTTNSSNVTNEFKYFRKENFPFLSLNTCYNAIILDQNPIILNSSDFSNKKQFWNSKDVSMHIKTFLGLPIFFNTKLIGILGLFNRPEGYDEHLIFKLQPFIQNLANYMFLKMYISQLKLSNNLQSVEDPNQ